MASEPTRLKPVDVAIVGGGWTGLTMARELTARTPLSVLVLERGSMPGATKYAYGMDEIDYSVRFRMMQNTADETITHRHSSRDVAQPVRQYGSFLPGTGVGGAGEHWAGLAWRFYPDVFTMRSTLVEKHGRNGLSPDLAVQDWGITYDDLEPHYWRAEQMMGVGGKAGNLRGTIVNGGNPFEGPRQHEYPLPPLKKSQFAALVHEGAEKIGLHPHPSPSALLSEPYRNPDGVARPGCMYCGFCERFGCMIGAKAQPTNTLLPVLQRRRSFQLRTGTWVRRIAHKAGRIMGVEYTDERGRAFFQPATTVVLATFTLNNVRLLYLSKIGAAYDPASQKGALGKNLTHQVHGRTSVFFDKPLNLFIGNGALATRISDYDGGRVPSGNDGVYRLGALAGLTRGDRPATYFGATVPRDETTSTWGAEWKAAGLKWYDRAAAITFTGEHLSWRQHYMDLDPTYTDKFGDPLLRFTLDWTEHENRQREIADGIARQIARAIGARLDDTKPSRAPYGVVNYLSTHIQGGAIIGSSPESSVVNRYLQHWELPDLFVVGASAFPQNPSHNPTLTAVALTTWAADAMIDRYFKSPGHLL
ncbi:MAG TPA: GMC family oxidoreductase [Gemmatimonadaceae bacterium]|nr:GMC family oxidoreductase [Gemmatimonadaceae bacterium]